MRERFGRLCPSWRLVSLEGLTCLDGMEKDGERGVKKGQTNYCLVPRGEGSRCAGVERVSAAIVGGQYSPK